jgi:hypothetical protein
MKKSTPNDQMPGFIRRITTFIRPAPRLTGAVMLLAAALSAPAGTFFSDFNSGLPGGTDVYGNASVVATGGYTNSGYLQLTPDAFNQEGSFVISSDLDNGNPVYGFNAQFKAFIGGGTGANGFGFDFGSLPASVFSEGSPGNTPGNGLTVTFRTYVDGPPEVIGIEVYEYGSLVAAQPYSNLRMNAWVDASVQLNPDGTLDVWYDNYHAYSNYNIGYTGPFTGQFFGFGGRTGSIDDNHGVDNLNINTYTNQAPFVGYFYPFGDVVRPDSPINILLTDYVTQVNTNTIVLTLDGLPVLPTVSYSSPETTVSYQPASFFAAGSTHTVRVTYADNSSPTPITNTFQYSFTAQTYVTLTNQASPSLVSANPGFNLRISEIDADLGPTLQRAAAQLANQFIDPTIGQPYVNLATVSNYVETAVINYSTAGYEGDFPIMPPDSIPGLPGTTGGDTNAAIDMDTYLYLPAGFYTLGVNSSDGFGLMEATTPDIFAVEPMEYNGVRASADTTFTFEVTNAGYYPFRILYFIGGTGQVNPTADNPVLEFFSVNALGTETLINDTSTPGYIAAYIPAATLPYISSATPTPSSTGVPYNTTIGATLVDGSITVQTSTIKLWLNGTAVTPTISSAAGITTVNYQPANLPLNSTNTVQFAFTDSDSNRRTNQWTFVVENILQQLWTIPPNSATNTAWAEWVTSGSTERGLAYNPKTGHVLLTSRSGIAGGAPSTGGIAILDGNTGAFLGTLDNSLLAGGVGTYHLDMIGVAADGVIYACNLTTSGSVPFQIYRWQNETAVETLIWNQNPLGGAARCGDDFRVGGSGAGTRIIASGNTTVSTISLFSTIDGTNFTGTAVAINGLGTLPTGGYYRLGLAFGCGNTFYGQNIGYPTAYCDFAGPPSTVGALEDYYNIEAFDNTLSIGPIGVDIANQRMIGDETSGGSGTTHSMNLYDLSKFSSSSLRTNAPIDHKTFATSTGSFGTGSVDFTPDGTRVYTLDTANGIIAFSLNPNVSEINICAGPQNDLVAGPGSVGYMGVQAIGAPQSFQWHFNTSPLTPGASVANATNRTLDIYNVQANSLGYYTVVISNSSLLTSVTSSPALLDIQMNITAEPVSQEVSPGGSATFTVAASGGLPPYSYQWSRDGANVGANSSSITINNTQSATAGNYAVVVTDALGQSVTSTTAVLSEAGAPQIVTDIQPSSLTVPIGSIAGFSVSATGSGTLSYQWYFNGAAMTDNSRVSGSLTSALTIAPAQMPDSGTYELMISNSTGYVFSSAASLAVTGVTFNNGAAWTANGNAIITNGVLELTEGSTSQNSSFWLNEPVDVAAFRASWIYQDNTGGAGANGVVFIVQNSSSGTSALGAGGGQIGYQGISPSVALGFNIYPNYTVGIQLTTNEFVVPFSATSPVNLTSGDPIAATVQYAGGVMSLVLTDSIAQISFSTNYAINVTNAVGGPTAYVGFTGSAGGVASSQTVSDFVFTSLVPLTVQNAGGGLLLLTWPTGTAGYLLQQNSTLSASGWVNVTNVPTVINNQNQVTVTSSKKTEFYRLSSQ